MTTGSKLAESNDASGSSELKQYSIRAGETLYEIAERNGVRIADLTQLNKEILDPDIIKVGQILIIPARANEIRERPSEIEVQIYTIQRGDVMLAIAERYGVSLKQLLQANPRIKNPDLIRAGQQIRVPIKTDTVATPPATEPLTPPASPADAEPAATGDVNAILSRYTPTGASRRTANQDRLGVTGVEASKKMAEQDLARMINHKEKFNEAGRSFGLPPAVLAAIASRETRCGLDTLLENGWGDNGNGFGLMQVDKRSHTIQGLNDPFGLEHILQATGILKNYLEQIARKHPTWPAERQLQGAIAAYNVGVKNVQTLDGMDQGTTGDDYSNDVWARAQFYAADWEAGALSSTTTTLSTSSAQGAASSVVQFTPAPPLTEVAEGRAVLRIGHRGEAVKLVQEQLHNTDADSKFGEETRKAVMKFQQAHDIKPSADLVGAVDRVTLELLGTVHKANPTERGGVVLGRHVVSNKEVADLLERIARFLGRRVIVTSGDRERIVNSNPHSLHLHKRAADFKIEGLTLKEAYERLKENVIPPKGYEFIYHTEVTIAPHLHIGRRLDAHANSPSKFIVDRGTILPLK